MDFSSYADRWWDEQGPMEPLHKMNMCRLPYIVQHAGLLNCSEQPLRVLDVGCGAGLVCEPLARLGMQVSGIDISDQMIRVAQEHAQYSGLNIDYQQADWASYQPEEPYDLVLALEVIEHVAVADQERFVKSVMSFTSGMVIFSTLNRTIKSFILGICAAEYVLRLLPVGTHKWRDFVKVSQMMRYVSNAGGVVEDVKGMVYNPILSRWKLSGDIDVNYLLAASCKGCFS